MIFIAGGIVILKYRYYNHTSYDYQLSNEVLAYDFADNIAYQIDRPNMKRLRSYHACAIYNR